MSDGRCPRRPGGPKDNTLHPKANPALIAGLEMLSMGVPVHVVREQPASAHPDELHPLLGKVVVVQPDDHGPLLRLLQNHPEIAIASDIRGRPTAAVLGGEEVPRVYASSVRPAIDKFPEGTLPADRILNALKQLGYPVKQRGRTWRSKCPYHGGKTDSSLWITEFADGNAWVHCYSGCQTEDILGALGLGWRDLFPPELQQEEPDSWVDTTELSNARRLVQRHGDVIRYCRAWREWLVWDGRRWKRDAIGRIEQLAKDTVRSIFIEAAEADDENDRTRLSKHAVSSQKRAQITNMVALAETEPGVPVETFQLDADPWKLNVLNGTINLRTGKLEPHDPGDLCTKLAPVEYDPEAKCPRWDRFLREVMAGDEELVGYLERAAGLSLIGKVIEHLLFFCYGTGRNGKDTYLETLRTGLGEYALAADPGLMLIKRWESHPENIANLKGRRLVFAVEPNQTLQMAEATVKWLTGGNTLSAREMYGKRFEFAPSHTLWLAANHRPVVIGQDTGIWSRIKEIPFTVSFWGREELQLRETLLRELPGILAWAVRGCLEWQKNGMQEPQLVTAATKKYRREMDIFGDFLEHTGIEGDWLERQFLYERYRIWCWETKQTPLGNREFNKELRNRGVEEYRPVDDEGNQLRAWKGIKLVQSDEEGDGAG